MIFQVSPTVRSHGEKNAGKIIVSLKMAQYFTCSPKKTFSVFSTEHVDYYQKIIIVIFNIN